MNGEWRGNEERKIKARRKRLIKEEKENERGKRTCDK